MGYVGQDPILKKVEPDEMIFVLRAKDSTAPSLVLEWIKVNFETVSEEKLREAFDCALEMKRFPTRRLPD